MSDKPTTLQLADIAKAYRDMAAEGHDLRGLTVLRYADELGDLFREFNVQTVLDYGCGAGDAYRAPYRLHDRWGLPRPIPYDPAFPKYARSVEGLKVDAVICIDVLEHLTEDTVDAVISALFGHAQRFVYASVCCRPAKKTFPDGTNLHTLVRPIQWWEDTFAEHGTRCRHEGRPVDWMLRETP